MKNLNDIRENVTRNFIFITSKICQRAFCASVLLLRILMTREDFLFFFCPARRESRQTEKSKRERGIFVNEKADKYLGGKAKQRKTRWEKRKKKRDRENSSNFDDDFFFPFVIESTSLSYYQRAVIWISRKFFKARKNSKPIGLQRHTRRHLAFFLSIFFFSFCSEQRPLILYRTELPRVQREKKSEPFIQLKDLQIYNF